MINSYNGIKIDGPNAAAYFKNVYGTVLKQGMYHDGSWDVGKSHTLWLRPKYWANSGLGTPPTEAQITTYTNANGTAVTLYKNDWGYYYDLFLEGYNVGLKLKASTYPNSYNGQFEFLKIQGGTIGIDVEKISDDNAVLFSSCNVSVVGASGVAVRTTSAFTQTQTLSFNSCTFSAPNGKIVDQTGSGVLNFVHNTFSDWLSTNKAINATGGSLLIEANYFNAD
jgi:hypothetical protein